MTIAWHQLIDQIDRWEASCEPFIRHAHDTEHYFQNREGRPEDIRDLEVEAGRVTAEFNAVVDVLAKLSHQSRSRHER
jgi:hypothetical protein